MKENKLRPRIAVIAYAFSPTRGSEYAQGWNYVKNLSREYEVTVFVGSSGGRMGDLNELENLPMQDGLNVVKVYTDKYGRFLNYLDHKLGLAWMFVYSLRRWNSLVMDRLYLIHSSQPFDVLHHLGPVGFKTPSSMHKLDVPSYWGPIGGFQFINLRLAFRSGKRYFLISLLRNLLTYCVGRSGIVRNSINGFDKVSFATLTNLDNFKTIYGVEGPIISDQAVSSNVVNFNQDRAQSGRALEVVWCGSVDARKNIRLLLDIAKRSKERNLDITFNVVGDGPLLKSSKSVSRILELPVVFHGHIPRPQVGKILKQSDILLSTSLSEANTAIFFEGLESLCVPIALDLDGFRSNITPDIGILIDTNLPYAIIVDSYVEHLTTLSNDMSILTGIKKNIFENITKYKWDTLFNKHNLILKELLTLKKD